jgi:hypothetical protein
MDASLWTAKGGCEMKNEIVFGNDIDAVKRRFESLLPAVDERMRRLIAAAESLAIDYGGISIVSHTYFMTDP